MRRLSLLNPLRTRIVELKTERLLLRQWRDDDRPGFAKLNADPEVMEFYPKLLSRQESDAAIEKFKSLVAQNGWGFWAVETLQDRSFIGLVGLHKPNCQLPVGPCVEVGWRLARDSWGQGYATEAGRACLEFAFERLDLGEVYSFASVSNRRSRAVMERLHLTNQNANFDHPTVPRDSPLREHVAYKIDRKVWLSKRDAKLSLVED